MDHLHKKPSPSNEVLALLTNFIDNYLIHAVSFLVANTLKIFHRDLRTIWLSKQGKIFSAIFLQCHTVARGWTYFPLLAYISCNIY